LKWRDNITIIVLDNETNDPKYYNFKGFIKKVLIWGSAIVLALGVGVFVTIFYLHNKIEELNSTKTQLEEVNRKLKFQTLTLQQQIAEQEERFGALQEQLRAVQRMLGYQQEQEKNKTLALQKEKEKIAKALEEAKKRQKELAKEKRKKEKEAKNILVLGEEIKKIDINRALREFKREMEKRKREGKKHKAPQKEIILRTDIAKLDIKKMLKELQQKPKVKIIYKYKYKTKTVYAPQPSIRHMRIGGSVEKRIWLTYIPSGRPVDYIKITAPFGYRIHPIYHRREFHKGIDLGARMGTPVYAPADGLVISAVHSNRGYGNSIIIQHNFGFTTLYGHLSKIYVYAGQYVQKGQKIGAVGSTGMSTGPHLHYEVRFLERPVNPYPFIQWSSKNFATIFKKVKGIPWQSLEVMIRRMSLLLTKRR